MYPAASASAAAAPFETSSSTTIDKLYFSLLYFSTFLQLFNYELNSKLVVFEVWASGCYSAAADDPN